MMSSRDGAFDFLSKLMVSSSAVIAVFGTRCGRLCFSCRITALSTETLTLEQYPVASGSDGESLKSFIALDAATGFAYGDIREATPEDRPLLERQFGTIVGALTLYFSDAEFVVIMEQD
jgi:hypothetical protein